MEHHEGGRLVCGGAEQRSQARQQRGLHRLHVRRGGGQQQQQAEQVERGEEALGGPREQPRAAARTAAEERHVLCGDGRGGTSTLLEQGHQALEGGHLCLCQLGGAGLLVEL